MDTIPNQNRVDFSEGHTPAEIRLRSLVNSHQRIAFGACACGKWDGYSISFGEHILAEMKQVDLTVLPAKRIGKAALAEAIVEQLESADPDVVILVVGGGE